MKIMEDFKLAKDYSCEEKLEGCQNFVGGQFWVCYQTVANVFGEKKAEDYLRELAKVTAEFEAEWVKTMWGKEFKNLEEITNCFDIIHKMVGMDSHWEWLEDKYKVYEKITRCPFYSTMPETIKRKDVCKIYCHPIGVEAYSRLNAEISREKHLCDGDPYCGCIIEWKGPRD
jgi:hypothetical protein